LKSRSYIEKKYKRVIVFKKTTKNICLTISEKEGNVVIGTESVFPEDNLNKRVKDRFLRHVNLVSV
jgi:hypothetical protein